MVSHATFTPTLIDISVTAEFILEAFESLGRRELPSSALDARRIPGRADTFVAVSDARELFLLVEADQDTLVEERRLTALRVMTGDDFLVRDATSDELIHRRFAVVTLRSGNEDLVSSFALVAATLLATLSDEPAASEIAAFVDRLMSLVAPRRSAAAATVIGLWGELWTIASSPDPAMFAAAWHTSTGDRFDFSFSHARLEIKTTATQARIHDFSLEQLDARDTKATWIGSLAVVGDASGQTVVDLLDQLLTVLPAAIAARVNRIALETVAGDIESVQDFAFAPIGAVPLLLFDAASLPRPAVEPGVGISAVRFRLNVAGSQPHATELGGILPSVNGS